MARNDVYLLRFLMQQVLEEAREKYYRIISVRAFEHFLRRDTDNI